MKIEYFGHSCFRITSTKGTAVVTDPYTKVGYELPSGLTADIVTTSHGHFDHNYVEAVQGVSAVVATAEPFVFDDVTLDGFLTYHDERQGTLRGKNIVFTICVDGLRICHLGDLGELCSESLIKKIGKVDVLLLPIGGTYTIDAVQAKQYVDNLKPRLVIPMHYKPVDGALDITDEKTFLRLCERVVRVANDVDIRKYLLEDTQILFMERKNNA